MGAHFATTRRHGRARIAAAVGAVLLLGAGGTAVARRAGHDEPDGVAAADTVATTVSTAPMTTSTTIATTTTVLDDPVLGNGEAVTLAFAGDTNFEGSIGARLAADPASVFVPVAAALGAADIAVVNMESALGTGGTAAPKEFTFQAPGDALEAYRLAGVDVVSAANNHGLDFGVESLQETLQAERDHGFPIIGIGADESEAYAPHVVEVRGQTIAIIGATQVLDDELIESWTAGPGTPGLASAKRVDRLVHAVTDADVTADTVVVFLHWGIERHTCPSASQQELAQTLADAGADVIVGGHAHRVQGGGRLGGAVVHYGLGNFAFGTRSPEGAQTGIFTVTVTGSRVDGYGWLPGRIVDGQPRLLEGTDADAARASWERQRDCTGLTP